MTKQYVYAVDGLNMGLTDVSKSEKGAKQYATRHGYEYVYRRNVNSGNVVTIWRKDKSGKWGII